MKDKKNSTIVDIAKRANVTNITVSRAFNKPDLVKPDTREAILKIAKELNYVPNAFARNLKNNESKIIGLVTDSTFNPVYANILKRLSQMADKRGYMVMIFETNGSESAENRAVKTLFSHKASAILLSVVSDREGYRPDYLELAKAYNIPLILFDRDIPDADLPGVFLNNVEIGVKAGKFLAKKDYSRYLICGGPADSEITRDRIGGIIGGLRASSDQIDYLYSDYSYEIAYPAIIDYLQSSDQIPNCVIGINGVISMAILKALRILGYKNIPLFSIDEVPFSDVYGAQIPCIANHPQDWGEQVGMLLFDILDGKTKEKRIYISSTLID
ncbi:LacI family transcriptional regulator [Vibrio sp.]|nr:LacI family transcriptional regulator [Vibrio sp.]